MKKYVLYSYLSYIDYEDGTRRTEKKQAHLDGSGMVLARHRNRLEHAMTFNTLQMLANIHIDEMYSPPDEDDWERTILEYRVYRVVWKWFLIRDKKVEWRMMNPSMATKLDLLCDL